MAAHEEWLACIEWIDFLLQAEMSAVGQTTSCTFASSGLGADTLAKPAGAFGGTTSWLHVGSNALGNQVVRAKPY